MNDLGLGTALLALAAAVIGPVALNWWWWRRDREAATQLAANDHGTAPFGPGEATPRVSFLVAAWNEAGMIERCMGAVARLAYPDLELVMCAGGTDDTLARAKQLSSARVIVLEQQAGEGKQHALQRCLEAANGEIIYLIDADCLISEDTFRRCLAPILRGGETVVTGSFYWPLPEQMQNPFVVSQMVSRAYSAAWQPRYASGLLGGNCVMRREALLQAGAFGNAVRTGTDYDLAKRLLGTGQRIRYVATGWIKSELPTTPNSYFRQQARWIRNVVVHGLRYRAYGEVWACLRTSAVGLAMLAGIPLMVALTLGRGPMDGMSVAAMAMWLALLTQAVAARMRYQRFTQAWLGLAPETRSQWRLPGWVLLDCVAWSLPLMEYPFQRLRGRW